MLPEYSGPLDGVSVMLIGRTDSRSHFNGRLLDFYSWNWNTHGNIILKIIFYNDKVYYIVVIAAFTSNPCDFHNAWKLFKYLDFQFNV